MSVAGEREHGTLLTMLAQPVLLEEVFLGKFLGLAAALVVTILGGFGLAALVIARQGGLPHVGGYLALVGYTSLFGIGYISLGFLISALTRRAASAVGAALFVWLVSVFLSDFGLIGTAVVLQLSPRTLLWLSLANPPQVFKLVVLEGIQRNLESLGPGGLYASEALGQWLRLALSGVLFLWAIVPFALSVLFSQPGGVMKRRRGIALLFASGMMLGCGKPDLSRPPGLRWGEEACAGCRMIISDERFAAALVSETREVLKFDDIDCLILHEGQCLEDGTVYWVRDFTGARWIKAREATFVYSTSLVTPMNHGLAALPSIDAASKLAEDRSGRTLQFNELPGIVRNEPPRTASSRSMSQ
jgi:Cu-processing system permease protein